MNLLEGIKILDFTRLLPGPLATYLLAEMGAEIIKIESPKRKDYARTTTFMVDDASILFHQLNHNKKLIELDYESDSGKGQLFELVKEADIIIEQFRPGAMEAWGLGYADIKKIKEDIIYVSISGYGKGTAYSQVAGHDLNYLSYSGIMSLLKDDEGRPQVPGTQIADISGSYMAIIALQAAVIKKLKTGEGSHIDVSLAKSVVPLLTIPFGIAQGGVDHNQFNILNGNTIVNYTTYQCKDDAWIVVAAMELKFWNKLCDIVSKPQWKRDNISELFIQHFPKEEVDAFFRSETRAHWIQLFEGEDVCVSPILEIDDKEFRTYHEEMGSFKDFRTGSGTELKGVGLPFEVL